MFLYTVLWLWFLLAAPSQATLEVFQVYHPVQYEGNSGSHCNLNVLLMEHVFASSYGLPYIGYYSPPKCEFDTVKINLTVTSQGRQFDRLALLFLGDTEIFRTSTAEPTADGIVWTYIKDISQYKALLQIPQKLIFDLGNIINDIYTGPFRVTLTAHFSHGGQVSTADLILPISTRKSASNSSSAFTVPGDSTKILYQIPPDTSRAVVSISACGQSTEEFWWSNVFSYDTETFNTTIGELYGYSPFREVQLYVDDILAGIIWPFPIIFTGGVAPGFWRPIVGIDAFDLRQPEIDISPFLSILKDGQPHSFEIKIVGLNVSPNGTATLSNSVGSYWVVTGNIFLYRGDSALGSASSRAEKPYVDAPTPQFKVMRSLVKNQTGGNDSLAYSVVGERALSIRSSEFLWSQNLTYSNFGLFNQQGMSQSTNQHTAGRSTIMALRTSQTSSDVLFEYPLSVNQTYRPTVAGLSIHAWMSRGLNIKAMGVTGISTYTLTSGPSRLRTQQWGEAFYQPTSNSSISFGDTTAVFESNSILGSYQRSVRAVNGSVVSDTNNRDGQLPNSNAQSDHDPFLK
ncbi:peptide N-acetyl-beta-D-glucosaminyl asparaginase amidase A-domain-containing protein [Aspergillus bertholletiae]|uniref:Peptide N-acetyl-beta-D-glucosaminyl asparaginase amidase A-domain-containing protein n=1 Tax=Aspergillus bertholletiae TaxID=1226010 RepID=A0A5N7B410_9EURO|nr:peptide N-acetyl-beta-D-glucosaminyl asparaginase amidase A-domain-containing protein [Aspergillus bertholletiae]